MQINGHGELLNFVKVQGVYMHLCHKLLDQTQNQTCSRYSYYKSVFQISFHYVQALLIKMNIFFWWTDQPIEGQRAAEYYAPILLGLYYIIFCSKLNILQRCCRHYFAIIIVS